LTYLYHVACTMGYFRFPTFFVCILCLFQGVDSGHGCKRDDCCGPGAQVLSAGPPTRVAAILCRLSCCQWQVSKTTTLLHTTKVPEQPHGCGYVAVKLLDQIRSDYWVLCHTPLLLSFRLYNGNPLGQHFGPKCARGDRIGCGIHSENTEAGITTVFFTKNGKEVSFSHNAYQ